MLNKSLKSFLYGIIVILAVFSVPTIIRVGKLNWGIWCTIGILIMLIFLVLFLGLGLSLYDKKDR